VTLRLVLFERKQLLERVRIARTFRTKGRKSFPEVVGQSRDDLNKPHFLFLPSLYDEGNRSEQEEVGGNLQTWENRKEREREGEGEKLREFRGSRNSGMVESERVRHARNSLLAAVAKFSASSARRRHYHKCLIHERRTRAKRLRDDSSVNACSPPVIRLTWIAYFSPVCR